VRTVARDRRLRLLLALSWLFAFWIIPEGLAAPYAADHGAGPAAVGILLAAAPAGNIVGVLVLTRWTPMHWRSGLLPVLAVASGLPLVACLAQPSTAVAVALWALSGLLSAYLVIVIPMFVASVPAQVRGQTIGIAASGLLAAQGLGLLVGGVFVTVWSAGTTIAVGGAIGSALAVPLGLAWRASRAPLGTSTAGAP
jgi:hypothetical protein